MRHVTASLPEHTSHSPLSPSPVPRIFRSSQVMSSLSEKAKGKRRAIEPPDEETANQTTTQRPVTVRFTEGIPDLAFVLERKDAVRELKRKVSLC